MVTGMTSAAERPRRPEVMVVEDDRAVRETLQELLEDEGYQVRPAANGREALDRLQSGARQPRLILLDLRMPVMDGWQFRAEMTRDPVLSAIPVVVMSADAGLERKVAGLEVAAVLAKPVPLDRLLDTVHQFL
jgi:CheY-like chemotaxis protein